jgi:CheY-like chemotaxis protein
MQRLLIRKCLESEGMRILEAKDGYEALELVANNAPDFFFMDVDMPGISGIETCRRLRARDDAVESTRKRRSSAHQRRHLNRYRTH